MKEVALTALTSILFLGVASCNPGPATGNAGTPKTSNLPKTKMKDQAVDAKEIPAGHETITLGGGCFWCVEAVYQQLEGVHSAVSGYMGGWVPNPTYEQICRKNTGHVEVVQLVFDPKKIPLSDVLAWFWELHDPTTKDRQGQDVGPQYASVVFTHDDAQTAIVKASMAAAQETLYPGKPIVTEIKKSSTFYKAEDYHQDFYFQNGATNGYCRAVIEPKLKKLKLKTQ
jgi:peptide-methionine (S)-S-oxide reductase